MSTKESMTMALRVIKKHNINHALHAYRYEDRGGTKVAARELGLAEEVVVKTLVFEITPKEPLLVLMPGHLNLSTKNMARFIGVKVIAPAPPDRAEQLTGYKVGGISPFGTKKEMPVYMAEQIFINEIIYLNAGQRGLLISLKPSDVETVLKARRLPADVAISD